MTFMDIFLWKIAIYWNTMPISKFCLEMFKGSMLEQLLSFMIWENINATKCTIMSIWMDFSDSVEGTVVCHPDLLFRAEAFIPQMRGLSACWIKEAQPPWHNFKYPWKTTASDLHWGLVRPVLKIQPFSNSPSAQPHFPDSLTGITGIS